MFADADYSARKEGIMKGSVHMNTFMYTIHQVYQGRGLGVVGLGSVLWSYGEVLLCFRPDLVEAHKKVLVSSLQNLITITIDVIMQMEDAIDDCKSGCTDCAAHDWDEAVAFYT